MVAGFSSSVQLASIIFPPTGAYKSDADLTDSTAPRVSPAATSFPGSGSSTKTTSPRASAAWAEMPIEPVA